MKHAQRPRHDTATGDSNTSSSVSQVGQSARKWLASHSLQYPRLTDVSIAFAPLARFPSSVFGAKTGQVLSLPLGIKSSTEFYIFASGIGGPFEASRSSMARGSAGREAKAILVGVCSTALICAVAIGHGASRSVELADVSSPLPAILPPAVPSSLHGFIP